MSIRWQVPADRDRLCEIRVSDSLLELGNDDLLGAGRVPGRRFVILDAGAAERWRAPLRSYLAARGIEAGFLVVPGGEQVKRMETVTSVLGELRRFGLDRRSEPIIVLGGGAVLDLGGFAASVYRRGVPWIRVPTTLFGYVAVSGAVRSSVHAGAARNVIASTDAPKRVLLDRGFLSSLPPREIASGLGKLLELGLVHDVELFTALEAGAETYATAKLQNDAGQMVLGRAIDLQVRRRQLGRGPCARPSFAAAFADHDHDHGPTVRHGEAAALGARLSATISARRGLLPVDELVRVETLGRRLGLPATVPDMSARALHDALTRPVQPADQPGVPLPYRIGASQLVRDITVAEIAAALDAMRAAHTGADSADGARLAGTAVMTGRAQGSGWR